MRILALTAGASGMYCGTCLRDNALAAELIRQGHNVTLVPIYTPTRTDEVNVSSPRVFFSGISIYVRQRFPRLPAFFDPLLDSPRLLKLATARSIPVEPRVLGELTISMLRGEDGNLRREFAKLVEWARREPPPDVIDLPYSLLIAMARPLKAALDRPICCTLQGEDLFLGNLVEPYRSEALALIRTNLAFVDVFIASSQYYAGFMSRYLSIPRDRIRVVPLGINLDGHAPVERAGDTFHIGYLARIAPEKGLHVLAEACRLLPGGFTLSVAGYLPAEHRGYLREIERRIDLRYHGEVDRPGKIRFLQGLDVLSVPSTYDEPKGLFVLEAMANGVPVVQPRRGAYPEIIERTQGGLLVEPDNPVALADGLRTLWRDHEMRKRIGRQANLGVREHHGISRMAERTVAVYRSLLRVAHA
jgi:glycosyltransferase involved in cell wall biosynthesis